MVEAGRGVVQQHGVRGLYRGLNITLLEIIPYAALQFGLYDTFTAAWSKARRSQISAKVGQGHSYSTFGMTTEPAALHMLLQMHSKSKDQVPHSLAG